MKMPVHVQLFIIIIIIVIVIAIVITIIIIIIIIKNSNILFIIITIPLVQVEGTGQVFQHAMQRQPVKIINCGWFCYYKEVYQKTYRAFSYYQH